jgi:hypothetical protein
MEIEHRNCGNYPIVLLTQKLCIEVTKCYMISYRRNLTLLISLLYISEVYCAKE